MAGDPHSILRHGLDRLVRELDLELECTDSQHGWVYRAWHGDVEASVTWRPGLPVPGATVCLRLEYDEALNDDWWMVPAHDHLGPQKVVGDPAFDAQVVVVRGHGDLCYRLSASRREALGRLVGQQGWAFWCRQAVLPPAGVARRAGARKLSDAVKQAMDMLQDLGEPERLEEMLGRWLGDDVEMLQKVLDLRVEGRLRRLEGSDVRQAVARIFAVPERGMSRLPRLAVTSTLVSAWCAHGRPTDERIVVRVERAKAAGVMGFWAAYALSVGGRDAVHRVTSGAQLGTDFVDGVLQAIRDGVPVSSPLVTLLIGLPPPPDEAVAVLDILREHAELSALLEVLPAWRESEDGRIRAAAIGAVPCLVQDAWERKDELALSRLRRWGEHDAALLEQVQHARGAAVDAWLATLRPEGLAVQEVLVACLADNLEAEDTLLWLLASGALTVQTRAAEALAKVGTGSALGPLHEAGAGWFVDSGLKRACQKALVAIRSRGQQGSVSLVDRAGGLSEPGGEPAE